jgi:hypothetical protein
MKIIFQKPFLSIPWQISEVLEQANARCPIYTPCTKHRFPGMYLLSCIVLFFYNPTAPRSMTEFTHESLAGKF